MNRGDTGTDNGRGLTVGAGGGLVEESNGEKGGTTVTEQQLKTNKLESTQRKVIWLLRGLKTSALWSVMKQGNADHWEK